MKKFITIAAAAAFAFSGMVYSASAEMTVQEQIDALLLQLAGLQGSTTTTVTGPAYVFSGTMRAGMKGPGVATLQAALNAVQNPDIVVDSAFGPATMAAVKQFQASQGLVADGIVGPNTGAALTAASTTVIVVGTEGGDLPEGCTSTSGYSSTTGKKCDEGTSPSGFPTTGGDEASLEKYSMDSEDDAEEGKSQLVATIEFDVEDGDAMVERLELTFDNSNVTPNADDEPWDVFDTITLMADGKELAEVDVDDEDDWNEDDQPFEFRINNLDYVVEEGDTAEIEVWLTANKNVDDVSNADWIIYVQDEGIRTIDTAGITSYIGDDNEKVSFSVDAEGGDEEINIKSSTNDPDSTLLLVDDNDKSDWHDTFVFRLEAEENDIDVETVTLSLETTGGVFYNNMIDEVTIEIDGDEYDVDDVVYYTNNNFNVKTASSGTTPSEFSLLSFDVDKDTTIDGDDEAEVVVMTRFKKQSGNYNDGDTVQFGAFSVDGEGEDDVADTSSLRGEIHTLSLSAAMITDVSWKATANPNGGNGTIDFFFTVDNDNGDDDFTFLTADVLDANSNTSAFAAVVGGFETESTEGQVTRVSGDTVITNTTVGYTVEEGKTVKFRVRYVANAGGTYEAKITEVAGVEVDDDDQLSPTLVI